MFDYHTLFRTVFLIFKEIILVVGTLALGTLGIKHRTTPHKYFCTKKHPIPTRRKLLKSQILMPSIDHDSQSLPLSLSKNNDLRRGEIEKNERTLNYRSSALNNLQIVLIFN